MSVEFWLSEIQMTGLTVKWCTVSNLLCLFSLISCLLWQMWVDLSKRFQWKVTTSSLFNVQTIQWCIHKGMIKAKMNLQCEHIHISPCMHTFKQIITHRLAVVHSETHSLLVIKLHTCTISPSCWHLHLLKNMILWLQKYSTSPCNTLLLLQRPICLLNNTYINTLANSSWCRPFTSQCVMCCRDRWYQIRVISLSLQGSSIVQKHFIAADPGLSCSYWSFAGHLFLLLMQRLDNGAESPSM